MNYQTVLRLKLYIITICENLAKGKYFKSLKISKTRYYKLSKIKKKCSWSYRSQRYKHSKKKLQNKFGLFAHNIYWEFIDCSGLFSSSTNPEVATFRPNLFWAGRPAMTRESCSARLATSTELAFPPINLSFRLSVSL